MNTDVASCNVQICIDFENELGTKTTNPWILY
jgi:hypothetical protein